MDSLAGKLLIAGADLFDPNFRKTVVLIAQHDEEGALGVVLNRVSEVSIGDAVPALAGALGPEDPVYIGGPVQPQGAVLLAEFSDPSKASLIAFDSIGFLLGEVDPEALEGVSRVRVYAGHAGWGPGQLEAEVEEDSWIVEPATAEDVFTDEPEELWSAVLLRKGKKYRLLATMPFDPSLN